MWPFSASWFETPESMSAMPTPLPVNLPMAAIVPSTTWSAPIAASTSAIIESTAVSPER
jgi:hypothetical protein